MRAEYKHELSPDRQQLKGAGDIDRQGRGWRRIYRGGRCGWVDPLQLGVISTDRMAARSPQGNSASLDTDVIKGTICLLQHSPSPPSACCPPATLIGSPCMCAGHHKRQSKGVGVQSSKFLRICVSTQWAKHDLKIQKVQCPVKSALLTSTRKCSNASSLGFAWRKRCRNALISWIEGISLSPLSFQRR